MISNGQTLSKWLIYITSIFKNERIGSKSYAKQAEAEDVPSSSLVEVEVWLRLRLGLRLGGG